MYWEGSKPKVNTSASYSIRRAVYGTNRWIELAKRFIRDNPLCTQCRIEGKVTPATDAGHIIPIGKCPDPFDIRNLEASCKRHNRLKVITDKKKYG